MWYNFLVDELRTIIGRNIVSLRKSAGMTQADLAAKLNYSDKAVSKWERGEAIPDIETLRALAGLFGITVDELISDRKKKKPRSRRVLIPLLSCALVWVAATLVYVAVRMFAPDVPRLWLSFAYALPVSAIICLVFSCVWHSRLGELISETGLIWTLALAVFFSIPEYGGKEFFFLLPLPLEALAVLWYIFRRKGRPGAPDKKKDRADGTDGE